MLGANLHRYKSNPRYLCLDVEGESLNIAVSRPWQVAWAIGDNKEILSQQMAFIKWSDLKVSRGSAIVSRFDQVRYDAEARDARQVLAELETYLFDPNVEVVWQGGLRYDVYALTNWRRALGLKPDYSYLPRSIDTDVLSKCKIKGWQPDISSPEAWLAFSYKVSGYVETGLKTNLTAMSKAEGIEHDYATTHDALSDVILTHKLLTKRVWQIEF